MEKQLRSLYLKASKNPTATGAALLGLLERRLDNVVYRASFADSRSKARQMVSHGHIMINDVRITIPSYNVKVGDKVKIREASAKKILFADLVEKLKDSMPPSWLKFDAEKLVGDVQGKPKLVKSELVFDIAAILEFYRR